MIIYLTMGTLSKFFGLKKGLPCLLLGRWRINFKCLALIPPHSVSSTSSSRNRTYLEYSIYVLVDCRGIFTKYCSQIPYFPWPALPHTFTCPCTVHTWVSIVSHLVCGAVTQVQHSYTWCLTPPSHDLDRATSRVSTGETCVTRVCSVV